MDPQLAGRLGCLQEANVAAMVAAETYKGDAEWEQFVDHVGRPWWWRQRDGLCFYEPAEGAAGTPAGRPVVAAETCNGDVGGSTAPKPLESRCCVGAAAATPGAPVWLRNGPGSVCARPGCGYGHKRGPRRHGFCCSACWCGEPYHTGNCFGQGRMVCLAGVAAAAATLEALPRGTRPLDLRQRATLSQMVRLPVAWKRNTEEEPLAYVLWFMHRYGLQLEPGAQACWERLSCKLSTVCRSRVLLL